MQDKSHEASGETRRDFLKKAGAVAWVVPTMQIVNMASAAADRHGGQTGGSVVTSTRPPSTSKTPECVEYKMCRVKADWEGGWHWDSGVGRNDCIQDGDWERCDASQMDIRITGDESSATVRVGEGCMIMEAAHKAGRGCLPAVISADGRSATFTANPKDISHVELVIKCCVNWD